MSAGLLQQLNDDLDAMDRALDAADFTRAGEVLAGHDQRLRLFLRDGDPGASLDGLNALLERQRSVTGRMTRLRDEASAQLRGMRQSGHAARAYRETTA